MPPKGSTSSDIHATMTNVTSSPSISTSASIKTRQEIVWNEIRLLINIAVPTVIITMGTCIPTLLTASSVGRHLGSVHLDGLTLANLTGNLLTLALLWGLFSASDTLSPQAYGAGNYKEVGLIAMRGFCGGILIVIPINIVLFFTMEDLLVMFGESAEPSRLAAQWYRVNTFTYPFSALYLSIWKFLSSQEILMPVVLAMLVSTGIVLPVSLGLLVSTWGFMGSALAILIFSIFQPFFLLAYLAWQKPHHPQTWPGLALWREALAWEPFKAYMRLGFGGILAGGEWVWWEFISLIIGTLGIVPLSAHTIPTQLLNLGYAISLGIGTALSIRLGSMLPVNVPRAKQLALWCLVTSSALFLLLSGVIYLFRESIYAIFTTDPLVLVQVETIWVQVVGYYCSLSIFGVVMGISVGLGMQWITGFVTLVLLWFVALPGLYIHAILLHGGLTGAWSWIFPPYLAISAIMIHRFHGSDWDAISEEIRKREGMDNGLEVSEETPLLL